MVSNKSLLVILGIFFPIITIVLSRSLSSSDTSSADAVDNPASLINGISLLSSSSSSSSEEKCCEPVYGFMPCTTTALGNLAFIVLYGHIMYLAAKFTSDGFTSAFSTIPNIALILASGLSGSATTAQSRLSIGMGVFAGSTVMLLTVIWGSCVVAAKSDIDETTSAAFAEKFERGFSLTGAGVTYDPLICSDAKAMIESVSPLIVVQLFQILHSASAKRSGVLVSFILSLLMVLCPCVCCTGGSVLRLKYIAHKRSILRSLKDRKQHHLFRLIVGDGGSMKDAVEKLFPEVKGKKEATSLRAYAVGLRLIMNDVDRDEATAILEREFGDDGDTIAAVTNFVNKAKSALQASVDRHVHIYRDEGTSYDIVDLANNLSALQSVCQSEVPRSVNDFFNQQSLEARMEEAWNQTKKSRLMWLLGMLLAAAFAYPMVDTVEKFSDASGIPSFIISFIALPLATISGEAVSALMLATRKTMVSITVAFSEIHDTVKVNNIYCQAVVLGIVYGRNLTWDFLPEVLLVSILSIVMGCIASHNYTYRLWTSLVAILAYPCVLGLLYLFHSIGW